MDQTIYSFSVKDSLGQQIKLETFKGKLLLIVNVASQCGFTKQYKGLEELYREFKDSGLEILAFPCNQFGQQEPGSDQEIREFCKTNYDVSFKLFSKINVNGGSADPLYKFLVKAKPGILGTEAIKWNFTKFLVSRDGEVLERFSPDTTPQAISNLVEELLK